MRRRIRDRLFVGAHSDGSMYWALAALGIVWAAISAVLGHWEVAVEGLLGAALIILLVWVLSGPLGWRFWPWR